VDKHGVFRVNSRRAATASVDDDNGETQFQRAMHQLDIAVIYANSAEAKGQVEKVNQTLQDRLVKEMRLRGISTIAEGNRYLSEFMEAINKKFAVVPKYPDNVHRALLPTEDLDDILCQHQTRVLSKQLTVSYQNKESSPLHTKGRILPISWLRRDQKQRLPIPKCIHCSPDVSR